MDDGFESRYARQALLPELGAAGQERLSAGSVLVVGPSTGSGQAVAYVAAGRSSYLDGGMYLWGLDPKSGKVLHQAHLDGPWPDISKDGGRPYDMEGAKSDILTSDGTSIYLLYNEFDLQLKKRPTSRPGVSVGSNGGRRFDQI